MRSLYFCDSLAEQLKTNKAILYLTFSLLRWYHGVMSRVEAEHVLKDHHEGSYLLRVSRDQGRGPDYSLAIKSVNISKENSIYNPYSVTCQVISRIHAS